MKIILKLIFVLQVAQLMLTVSIMILTQGNFQNFIHLDILVNHIFMLFI